MPDAFDALALPVDRPLPGTEPAPGFTAALRARLERALLLETPPGALDPGGTMTRTLTRTPTATGTAEPAAAAPVASALTPYLSVADARAAMDFYVEVFGAVRRGEPYVQPDGRIGHAELVVGGALLMLADEFPEMGLEGPLARGGVSASLHLEVPDVDAVLARAVAAGAVLEREATDAPYGRTGVVRDPAGHRWMLQAPVRSEQSEEPPAAAPRPADVAYVTVAVPDAGRARAFYGAVLGWSFAPGTVEDGWQVPGTDPAVGLWGGQDGAPEVQLCYRVPDLARALAAVREHGGSAQAPDAKPYGLLAECVDPAGLRFQLWEAREG